MTGEAPDYKGIVARAARGEYQRSPQTVPDPLPVPEPRSPEQVRTWTKSTKRNPYARFEEVRATDWGQETQLVIPQMTREEALEVLWGMTDRKAWPDREKNHEIADLILLMLLDDVEIEMAFDDVEKWYS